MNIEKKISEVVQKQMDDGVIEEAVKKHFQSCVDRVVRDLFSYDGIVYESIQNQVKSTIVPFLEGYDYSHYIVKLDAVMTELLKTTTLNNRMILENFTHLMTTEKIEEIKMSELFKKYCEYCKEHINDYKLAEDYIKEITCSFEIEEFEDSNNWGRGRIFFKCEEDEDDDLTFEADILCYCNSNWSIRSNLDILNLKGLNNLKEFEILLMRLSQCGDVLIVDDSSDCEEICLYEEE